jgi:glucose-6-phosphate 1-dehydrogenase
MASSCTSFVIFGATGDLSQRKLIPALFNLQSKNRLPENLRIVGFSRTHHTDESFREYMWDAVRKVGGLKITRAQWQKFASQIHYVSGSLTDLEHLRRLRERLAELEKGHSPRNRLIYLSIAPHLYETAITTIGASHLAREDDGWRRIVIEKPFGRDLSSARELNDLIGEVFREDQVFRIDHYLGKETVQNLLVLRFGNAIFEPIWNRNYVDNVQITVAETDGVGDRAGYYDQSGVVRDMLQNHLLQLLTIVAMEPPSAMDAESLRSKKVDVLKAIRRLGPGDAQRHGIRGQYRGYLEEKGVPPDSATATYVGARLFIDNWRWHGVPFYLRTGKALAGKVSEIVVEFIKPPHQMFSPNGDDNPSSNVLSLCLQPNEGVQIRFEVKVPDEGMLTRSVDMEFHYKAAFGGGAIPEAYERLLQDALEGEAALFIRSDQIDESWRIVEPLLPDYQDEAMPLRIYEPGTWGPEAADALIGQDGRSWLLTCGDHEGKG